MLSDKALLDWLAERNYVEATLAGNEDRRRFEFIRSYDAHDLREALSRHIMGQPRVIVSMDFVELSQVKFTGAKLAQPSTEKDK